MDRRRLELLLHRYFDQLLEPAERIELEAMLLSDPAARERFWELARFNALIRSWGEMQCGSQEAENFIFQPLPAAREIREPVLLKLKRLRRWWIPITAAAFGVIMALAVLRVGLAPNSPSPGSAVRPEFSGVARVTRLYQAKWAADNAGLQPGQALNPGWLRLKEGAAEIEFSRGARVVLQGPAELLLISENEAFLRNGKLNAVVPPPAHGFKVNAPGFDVVDHGTQFGCIVGTDGLAEVHVFAGVISWEPHDAGISSREMKAGQALKISGPQVQAVSANPALFLTEDDLARLDAWQNESLRLQHNPAGLVYLDFQNADEAANTVPNLAQHAPADSDARVIGCKFVAGRFPGKTGVEFTNAHDRLRLTVPGKYDALTFLTWVRIDALPLDQASLAMTESFTTGEVHWFVHYNGCFGLGIHTKLPNDTSGWALAETPPGVLSTNLGSWIMLATTFDRITGKVTHYLNGKPIATGEITTAHMPLHLDTFEIGNWGVSANDPRMTAPRRGHPGDMVRNLNGCMDEFAILNATLRPEDIQQLYREGRPGDLSNQTANRADGASNNQ